VIGDISISIEEIEDFYPAIKGNKNEQEN